MNEITKIYNKIQEANALLIDANRCLLEATEITKKICQRVNECFI